MLRPCHPSPTSVSNLSELIVIGCAAPYLALNCGHLKVQKDVLDEACIMHSPCKCSAGQLRQWMGCGRLLLCRHSHSRCRRGPLCAPTRSQRRVSCFRLFLVTATGESSSQLSCNVLLKLATLSSETGEGHTGRRGGMEAPAAKDRGDM